MRGAEDTSVQQIGRYEVRGELGTGGMAVVYRAHDPRLEREVAVKVLHPHLARDAESRARFEREARAAARLRHANIVEVYEFSEADDRESFMVTELLEGPTLRRFVELHGTPPAEVAAAVGVVLCDALACAHAQGVVHRDVKPDNLLLQRGRLKLTDFGIAHVADAHGMTATGQVLGSPAHMAPEQIEGTDVDARTDLFAAGTVLYLLAVGRLPFQGTTAHALLRKILDGDFVDAARAAPAVGHRLAAIIARALAREPGARYDSAEAMRDALCAFVREVGWEFPEQELSKYFLDPEGFCAALDARLRERLPALGLAAQRAGDIGAAMGYFNRALALDPGNAKVLALVRGVARRRQLTRAARTGAIVTAVASVTAVAAVAALRESVPPRPAPVAVLPVTPEATAPDPTPVVVRATERPAEVPPASPEVTAPVDDDASPRARPRAPDRASDRAPERTADRAPRGPDLPSVMAAAGAVMSLVLRPYPLNVQYSFDGRTWRDWDSRHPSLGNYPKGRTVRFWVRVPGDLRYEQQECSATIPQSDGLETVHRVTLRPRRIAPTTDGTAAVIDASVSPRLN